MGSASSDLEQSSSVSGEGSATRDDAEEERSSSDHGGEGTTTTSAPPGGLFLKRSLDDDFANNNRDSEQDADGESRTAEGLKEPAAAASAANENNKEPEEEDDMEEMETDEPVTSPLSSLLPPVSTNLQNSNVGDQLKEQLQKISMTISQLSNSIANNSSPKNVQELAVLQATLFSLQQQQLLQMQILSQMQQSSQERSSSPTATAASSKEKEESPAPTIAELAKKMEQQNSLSSVLGLPEKQPGSGTAHSRMKDGEHGSGNSTSSVLGALGALAAGGGPNSTPLPPSMPPKPSPGSMLTGSGLAPATSSSGESNKNNGLPMSRHQPPTSSSSLSSQILDPNAPPSLASSIIIHHDDNSSAPPAVNSLELLQQRAQGILNNASQGLLANNLADFSVSKDKDYERKGEPFFKHRCRYCGKVFGSDSALQIHVRSHTGERPYKCNICGNRFTTKGNLKVHFQRHSSKFPNIKMNPNLVPEHLDKFYPPLLQQIEDAEKKGLPIPSVNNPMAGMTPIIPPGLTLPSLPNVPAMSPGMGSGLTTALTSGLVTPPGQSSSPLGSPASIPAFPFPSSAAGATTASTTTTTSAALAAAAVSLPPHLQSLANLSKFTLPTEPLKREEMPQNLSKGERSRSVSPMSRDERMERMERMAEELKRENNKEEPHSPRSATIHVDDEDEEEVESRRAFVGRKRFASSPGMHGDDEKMHKDSQEEPENLTKSGTRSVSPPRDSHHHLPPGFPGHGRDIDSPTDRGSDYSPVRMPFGFPGGMFHGPRGSPMMPPSPQGGRGGGEGGLLPPRNDPAKDPNVYTNLLPRPGSNDNAWESLIEVNKASETTKLEQLVNTIEHKLSDPNECVICHRVLSCKSALQMHYRTHTGERPFKCRICGRAFTTKGNLKTHMGVHRAKPPMRMFHQCPVCHKKYANALVLQQHIKTHTGEPTELTTEQIAAAEIREFPPLPFPGQFPGGFPGLRLPGSGLFPGLPAQFAHGGFNSESQSPEMGDREDIEGEEKDQSRPSSVSSSTSSMKNASFPSFPGGGNLPTSIPSSLANLESLVRSNSEMMPKLADHRPFSLVRPFLMDKQQQQQQIPSLPEDLSSPIRKPENGKDEEEHSGSPVSPPKYSPEPPVSPKHHGKDEEDRRRARSRSRERNGGTRSPKTPSSSSPDVRPLALDLTPRPGGLVPPPTSSAAAPGVTPPGLTSMFGAGFPGLIPPPGLGNPLLGGASVSALNQLNALANPVFNPLMGLPFPHGGLPGQIRSRGNTTCHICLKVFACNSALEIHIRSHTKERPFKCNYCDRGFSTKGNMKQHALTHKTQDGTTPVSTTSSNSGDSSGTPTTSAGMMPTSFDGSPVLPSGNRSDCSDAGNMSDSSNVDMRMEATAASLKRSPPQHEAAGLPMPKRPHGLPFSSSCTSPTPSSSSAAAFSTAAESGTAAAAATSAAAAAAAASDAALSSHHHTSNSNSSSSSNNKHLCHVCKKNFSSGSALQIHMRTHTGDRPFKCSVCGKAFTTKGNLKVHMGTHMWSSSQMASRRGRRMSLELPHHAPPIPMNAKDSEFLQRRPELFFPYTQHAAAAAAAVQQQQQFNSSMAAAMAAAAAASAAAANGMNSTVTTHAPSFPSMSPRNGDGDGMKIPPFPAPPSPLASPNSSSDLSAGQPIPPSSGLKASSPAEVFPLSSNVAARDTESPELLHVRSRPREESERKDEAEAEEEEDTQQQQQQLSHQPWNWKVQQTSAGGTKRKAVEHLDISNDDEDAEDEQHEDDGGAVRAEDDVLEPPPPAPASAGLIQQQAKPESLAA